MSLRKFVSWIVGLVLLCGATGQSSVQVPQAQIDAVNARWHSLGVTLPKGGIVLGEPFEPPYSNRSFIVPPEWFWDVAYKLRDNPKLTVSATAMRADLPVLRLALEKVYAGYGSMRDRGWDWDAFFASWDDDLTRNGDTQILLRTALAPWGRVAYFEPDGHLGPFIAGFHDLDSGASWLTAELASAPAATCTAIRLVNGNSITLAPTDASRQPHAVHAWDGTRLTPAWYVTYLERNSEASSIDCGGKGIALRMTAQPRRGSAGPAYHDMGDGIGYLRVPFLFDVANDQALRDTVSKVHGLGKERVLLLDLRGNGGGAAPTDILKHWFSSGEISAVKPFANKYTTESCLRNALMFNMFQYLTYTLKPPLSLKNKQWMQAGIDMIATTPRNGCGVKDEVTHGPPVVPQTPFTKRRSYAHRTRVLAIIDNGCGSDCTYMAHVVSRLPDTVVVGTSIGVGEQGTAVPGLFVLPHTHIPFIVGTERLEGIGETTVDVLLPTATSQSMKSLVSLAKALGR